MKTFKTILLSFFCVAFFFGYASEPALKFIENKNQFDARALYMAEITGGGVFLEHSCFTYVFYNPNDLNAIEEQMHSGKYTGVDQLLLHGHAYKMHLQDANETAAITGEMQCREQYNYFLGNDKAKWAGNVSLYGAVRYHEVYPQIDLKVYSEGANAKYDFIAAAGADVSKIALRFEGTDELELTDGVLKIKTSVATIVEQKPFAFQLIDGKKKEVRCEYALQNETVSFQFPEGYNHSYELVIDPVIVAATYSGTTYRAYAHTAAYDQHGNIYSAGRAFSVNANGTGAGYPATAGAFQTTHHGGYQDICVSKYNPDGSALIWATYIGGSGQEQPHSLFVDANDQLYIYGTSNSTNYPVSANAYQPVNLPDNFGNHLDDIVVTKLNSSGSALLGSTYVGGRSEEDGTNWSTAERYYGDRFKGEIVVDSLGNAYVASYTRATDFPITAGAFQATYGGGYQDGVLFKLNSDLSSLVWSTFIGGNKEDACYGLRLDANGDLFVTGGVSSNAMTNTSGTIHTSYQGGLFDAFVMHVRADGQAVLKSTYFGSAGEEQAYLLDLDKSGNVYIFGSSPNNAIQATANAYQAVGVGAFIAKLKPTLDSVLFVTTFNEIAPTALMVDECGYIYAVGHGGLNTSIGTCTGFQLTPDAFQTGSGGFYMLTLEPDAIALKFGSYYGPTDSHVDGGTCRFDKRGIIYHALCTDKTTLYTTANAFHTTKLSNDFDATVFKIDFQAARVYADALATIAGSNDTSANVQSCNSNTVQFINHSTNAVQYVWYFGNGDSSTAVQSAYTFSATGSHIVMFVAMDSTSCNKKDTAYVNVSTGSVALSASATNTACNSTTGSAIVTITSGTGPYTYAWSNGGTSASISNLPSGNYTVTVTASGSCTATASATVVSSNGVTLSTNSTNTSCGNNNGSAIVTATTGATPFSYLWSNGAIVSSLNNLPSGNYTVTVSDLNGCSATASVLVDTSNNISVTIACDKPIMCIGDSAHVCVTTTHGSYLWNLGQTTQCIYTKQAGNYYLTVTDGNCTATSNHLAVNIYPLPPVSISVNGDTMTAYSAVTYQWYLNDAEIANATSHIYVAQQAGYYSVAITDTNGCRVVSNNVFVGGTGIGNLNDDARVELYPNPINGNCELRIFNFEFKQPLSAFVFDVEGRKVFEQKIIATTTKMNLMMLESGVYFLKVNGNNFTVTKKIIKD